MRKMLFILFTLVLLTPLVFSVSNVQHFFDEKRLTLTYDGNPPFLINIRDNQNIGESGGFVWAKTNSKQFTIDLGFANNPSTLFYYGVRDSGWSSVKSFDFKNECFPEVSARCYSKDEYQMCSDYDGDGILLWSNPYPCSFGEYCEQTGSRIDCKKNQVSSSIKIGVIEFEAKDDFTYSKSYYCCRKNPLSEEKECFWTDGQLNCEFEDKSFSFLDVLHNLNGYYDFEILGENSKSGPHSIYYINEYFKKEAARYGKEYDYDLFEVDLLGPYKLSEDPPLRGRNTGSTQEIEDFFDAEIDKQGINKSKYDSLVIYFFNDFQENGDYPGFVSFAPYPNIYISVDATINAYSDDKVEVFMHENAHNLGYFLGTGFAWDLYEAPCSRGSYSSCCILPDGIPEPNKEPLYPQNKACLMCGSIMLTEDGEGQGLGNLDQTQICPATAKEFDWLVEFLFPPVYSESRAVTGGALPRTFLCA